ncbi:mitochondrial ribosomal protein subunit L20-domain-containing protein [Catenaria anguillulae PL171]|uniref:Mitochondrial ribosomal protein subunit L20-domain-containing protein n=1 Tax=Catenaria anguillulae PL171 TaxID=765915 RepID=A0A1Y2HDT7_9FUNG|nr:mitochondrial ribosomal protein subunit L20-domain-containing protein [Catenaria anguillulae PL171]
MSSSTAGTSVLASVRAVSAAQRNKVPFSKLKPLHPAKYLAPRPIPSTPGTPPALASLPLMPAKPLEPLPIKLKAKSLPKLLPHVAKLSDGTTIHLNSAAFEPVFDRGNLPPTSHKFAPTKKVLTAAEIQEIKALRAQDPDQWTVRKLAAKYGVSGIAISIVAKCPEQRAAKLAEVEAERVARLPPSTLQHIRDRQRRRELW